MIVLSRMKSVCVAFVTLFGALAGALVSGPAAAQATHIQPRLVSESAMPAGGTSTTIAIEMRTEKGWHGYWKNPGEAGVPPILRWTLPKGVTIGEPRFPVPKLLTVAGLANYVFESDHALLLPLTVPAGLAPGTKLPIALSANWLACTDEVCVPEQGSFTLDLTVGNGTPDSQARFDAWRQALPMPLGGQALFARSGKELRLAIPWPASAPVADPHFYPGENGLIADAEPQRFTRAGDTLIVSLVAADGTKPVSGLLSIGDARGIEFAAIAGAVPPDGTPLAAAVPNADWTAVLLALSGALLGGLILNVMPCVFPIVSLKALSLAKAGGDERSARRDALGYTLGAVLVCLGLGAAILALRAGGTSVGWAFQLQNPGTIVALLVLVVAIAFNFAGLFELPAIGGNLASGNSIATGALAAFVGTPCAGPFLGAALGAALVLPTAAALSVFAGLGFGLALPFLLIGFVPALRKRMPRPGAWMATLRRILSLPMFGTALWLAWLLGRQTGSDGLVSGLGAALLAALAFWWTGLRQKNGKSGLVLASLVAVIATAISIAYLPVKTEAVAVVTDESEPFTEARLKSLRATKTPVFVYFTADWCLVCKVNERIAIAQPSVQAAFAKKGVKMLVGDWSRSDPVITRFLETQGRAGVPLYLYYAPGAATPQILPQILTPGVLIELER